MPIQLSEGALGIDTNNVIKASSASDLVKAGYSFALRYIPRTSIATSIPHDLNCAELGIIRKAGLLIMPVQHVENESRWVPTADKGHLYGEYAGTYCNILGIERNTTVWLDLEGVGVDVNASIVIEYCNNWYDKVVLAGYKPGLYVGWRAGLSATRLYKDLKFALYWGAYNLNKDQFPITRGLCMKQSLPRLVESLDIPTINFNKDLVFADLLGSLPYASG